MLAWQVLCHSQLMPQTFFLFVVSRVSCFYSGLGDDRHIPPHPAFWLGWLQTMSLLISASYSWYYRASHCASYAVPWIMTLGLLFLVCFSDKVS
jgi:hypothetical protein